MARFQTQITVDGIPELKRGFNQVIEINRDFTDVWQEVKPVIFEIEQGLFNSEGASGEHGKWQPLTPKYEEVKFKAHGIKPILQAKGDLYKSLTSDTSDTIFETSKNLLTFGSVLPQFKGAMRGNPKKNVPQRLAVDMTDKDKQKLGRAMRKKLVEKIKKTGFKVEGGE